MSSLPTVENQLIDRFITGLKKDDLPDRKEILSDFAAFGKKILGRKDKWFHIKMRQMIQNERRGIFLLPRGFAKCIASDSLVQLQSGALIRIGDLRPGNKVLSLDKNLKMCWSRVLATEDSGFREALEIRTASGNFLAVSPEHRLLTESGFVPASEITEKSWLALPRHIPHLPSTSTKWRADDITDSRLRLLGYWLAEGHCRCGMIRITISDTEARCELQQIAVENGWKLSEYGGSLSFSGGLGKPSEKSTRRGRWSNRKCKYSEKSWALIERYELDKCSSATKFIPGKIFTLSNRRIALFLNALYTGDGWVEFRKRGRRLVRQVNYATTSKVLAFQVQQLLLRFGITSRVQETVSIAKGLPYTSYTVNITNIPSILKFAKIGFSGSKQLLLVKMNQELLENVDWEKQSHSDLIPVNWREFCRLPEYHLRQAGIRTDNHEYVTTRVKLKKVANLLSSFEIHQLVSSDIFWTRVKSVRYSEPVSMTDIQVEGTATFVVNGLISHNSTIASVESPLFFIAGDRDIRILLGTNAIRLGMEWLREIEVQMQDNAEYRKYVGNLIPDQRTLTWTDTEKIVLGRSPSATHTTLYALSVNGSTLGKRADVIILDDIFEPEQGIATDAQIRRIREWFWKILYPIAQEHTKIFVVGTRFSPNDLYGELIEKGWPHLVVPALDENDESTWPEMFSTQELKLRRTEMGTPIFNLQYQNIATSGSFFKEEWVRAEIPPKGLVIFQGIDPSLPTSSSGSDFFVDMTVGVDNSSNRIFILDMVRTRAGLMRQLEIMSDTARIWKPRTVALETNAAQILIKEAADIVIPAPVKAIQSKLTKVNRLLPVFALFESGRIIFAATGGPEGPILDPKFNPIVEELLAFPDSRHDDTLDALEKAVAVATFGGPVAASRSLEIPVATYHSGLGASRVAYLFRRNMLQTGEAEEKSVKKSSGKSLARVK